MKKVLAVAAVVAAALSMVLVSASPVSAGNVVAPTMVVTPDPVEAGGPTVVITNADDGASTCEPYNPPAADSTASIIDLSIEDPNGDIVVANAEVVPDTD